MKWPIDELDLCVLHSKRNLQKLLEFSASSPQDYPNNNDVWVAETRLCLMKNLITQCCVLIINTIQLKSHHWFVFRPDNLRIINCETKNVDSLTHILPSSVQLSVSTLLQIHKASAGSSSPSLFHMISLCKKYANLPVVYPSHQFIETVSINTKPLCQSEHQLIFHCQHSSGVELFRDSEVQNLLSGGNLCGDTHRLWAKKAIRNKVKN